MYYIQRYQHSAQVDPNKETLDRFIENDYMGGAEFEFGSVGGSWKFLRENDIEIVLHTVYINSLEESSFNKSNKSPVTFYVTFYA